MRPLSIVIFTSAIFISCSKQEPSAQSSADEVAIRAARDISNNAIAGKDSVMIDDAWMQNFQMITSRDNEVRGMEANRKSFVDIMDSDATYVRTPDKIDVMETWGMASEYGNWVGTLTVDDEKIEIGGTYYAKWHKVNDKWLLRAEIFTPTHCKGGGYCKTQPINK